MKMNQSLFDEVVGCIQKACEGAVGEVHLESRLREDLGDRKSTRLNSSHIH